LLSTVDLCCNAAPTDTSHCCCCVHCVCNTSQDIRTLMIFFRNDITFAEVFTRTPTKHTTSNQTLKVLINMLTYCRTKSPHLWYPAQHHGPVAPSSPAPFILRFDVCAKCQMHAAGINMCRGDLAPESFRTMPGMIIVRSAVMPVPVVCCCS